MHMAWVRQVCGRLESRYRYSATLVYNNFPWPPDDTGVSDAGRAGVEAAAQAVLDARAPHLSPSPSHADAERGSASEASGISGSSTLADLYDPLTMPPALAKAHAALDRAVDRLYRSQPFPDERRRFEHLFTLYESLIAPLTGSTGKKRRRRRHAL